MHRVPTLEAYNQELERLHALGVAVLQSGEHDAYLDTEPERV